MSSDTKRYYVTTMSHMWERTVVDVTPAPEPEDFDSWDAYNEAYEEWEGMVHDKAFEGEYEWKQLDTDFIEVTGIEPVDAPEA